jgi:hypothetical protein
MFWRLHVILAHLRHLCWNTDSNSFELLDTKNGFLLEARTSSPVSSQSHYHIHQATTISRNCYTLLHNTSSLTRYFDIFRNQSFFHNNLHVMWTTSTWWLLLKHFRIILVLAALYLCDVSVTPTGLNYTPTLFNSNWSELALLISDSLLSSVFNNLLALYFSSWSTLWLLLITLASFNYSL